MSRRSFANLIIVRTYVSGAPGPAIECAERTDDVADVRVIDVSDR